MRGSFVWSGDHDNLPPSVVPILPCSWRRPNGMVRADVGRYERIQAASPRLSRSISRSQARSWFQLGTVRDTSFPWRACCPGAGRWGGRWRAYRSTPHRAGLGGGAALRGACRAVGAPRQSRHAARAIRRARSRGTARSRLAVGAILVATRARQGRGVCAAHGSRPYGIKETLGQT